MLAKYCRRTVDSAPSALQAGRMQRISAVFATGRGGAVLWTCDQRYGAAAQRLLDNQHVWRPLFVRVDEVHDRSAADYALLDVVVEDVAHAVRWQGTIQSEGALPALLRRQVVLPLEPLDVRPVQGGDGRDKGVAPQAPDIAVVRAEGGGAVHVEERDRWLCLIGTDGCLGQTDPI